MLKYLILLFVGIPFIEIVALLYSGKWFGLWPTLLLIVTTGVLGAYLAKREGMKAWQQFQYRMQTMDAPGLALIDSVLIGMAGILLVLPGFITDIFGFLLLFPFIRKRIRPFFIRKLAKKMRNDEIIIINGKRIK